APVAPAAAPAAGEERKKEAEVRRPPKREEEDERRDRKHAQHRPSIKEKEKTSAPRVVRTGVDDDDSFGRRGGGRGKSKLKKRNQHGFQSPTGPIVREVSIGETITVAELAQQMSVKGAEVVKFMFKMGTPVTINQ
ncbi:translation initiation factor IF-2 N-terminal domain-containing protein, partial [Pseudomonas aeruginosa]